MCVALSYGWSHDQVIREKWKRPDVQVGSDCGAVMYAATESHYVKACTRLLGLVCVCSVLQLNKRLQTDEEAAAVSLNGGCDVDMGDPRYWSYYSPVGTHCQAYLLLNIGLALLSSCFCLRFCNTHARSKRRERRVGEGRHAAADKFGASRLCSTVWVALVADAVLTRAQTRAGEAISRWPI